MAPPTITAVSPLQGTVNGYTLVQIWGTGLSASRLQVRFGLSTYATNIIVYSDTHISVRTPKNPVGTYLVVVTTANGFAGNKLFWYKYVNDGIPRLFSLSQSSGPVSGANTITITGTNLITTTNVSFGSTSATSFAATDDTTLVAVVPPSTGPGSVNVTVTNEEGTSNALSYTYTTLPVPSVSSVSPASGPNAGGNDVTIVGSGNIYIRM